MYQIKYGNILKFTHLFLGYIFMSKQLFNNRFEHGISDKVHEFHLPLPSVRREAGVELSGEDWTHRSEVGRNQPPLDGVVHGTVVLEEGRRRETS